MSNNEPKAEQENEIISSKKRQLLEITELEADLAYCDTRLSMIGPEPETSYQLAQVKVFRLLEKQLRQRLAQVKRSPIPS